MVEATVFSVLIVGSVILSTIVWLYLVWLTAKLLREPEGLVASETSHGR